MTKVPLTRLHLQVRIFNKLHNMRRILHATFAASAAMMNAFLLFVVIISIYAVMAVNLFSAHVDHPFTSFSRSFYTLLGMVADPCVHACMRACVPSHVGTRMRACMNAHMNQHTQMHARTGVATGEDWSFRILNTLAEESCVGEECGGVDTVVAVYFVSFIALVQMISFNIIVAVLIQGFTLFMHEDDTSKRMQDEAREHHKNAGPMDPLLATLANFTSPQVRHALMV